MTIEMAEGMLKRTWAMTDVKRLTDLECFDEGTETSYTVGLVLDSYLNWND
jgi:hypothetical protein